MTRNLYRALHVLLSPYKQKKLVYKTGVSVLGVKSVLKSILDLSNMPVITALAVAAHRQNNRISSENNETHAQLVSRRLRLLSCGSADAERLNNNPVLRKYSFGRATSSLWSNIQEPRPLFQDSGCRSYSKGMDKGKGTKKAVVNVNEDEMAEIIDVDAFKKQLDRTMEQMKEEYSTHLSIRGAASALETLHVQFEGETFPLQELAQVGRKNPQLAVLSMASLPDAIQPVLHALRESGMNLNPQQEGTTIYVPLPKVTREHRENLAKNAKAIFNKYKTNWQAVQNKYIKQCKAQKDTSEDLSFRVQQQIMKMTESYVLDAEKLMQLKQAELLEHK